MSQHDHQPTTFVHCVFASPSCSHEAGQPLFSQEYKRTNRTRATKVVRCFPHCCPTHRPRSYCGTSLHVEISGADGQAHPLSDLIVLGRFEEHLPGFSTRDEGTPSEFTHLELGQRVNATDILGQPSRLSPWVTGKLVEESSSGTTSHAPKQLYVLHGCGDGFNHWEYDWKSGTSQRHRLTQHHFRVYVFTAHAPGDWEVVGIATSPPFTFAVYRKHQHDPELHRLQADSTAALELVLPRDDQGHGEGDDASTDTDEHGADENQGRLSSSVVRDLLWHHQHRSTATTTTSITILALMAHEADPGWLMMHSRSLFALLQAVSETSASPDIPQHFLLHYVNHCVPQLMALLPRRANVDELVDHHHSDRVHSQDRLAKWQSTMELLSGLLCFLLEPAQVSSALGFLTEAEDTTEGTRALYVRWIELVADQIEGFLQGHGQSTESLVDDIVSTVLGDKGRRGLQHQIRSLLRNTEVMGKLQFAAFHARLRTNAEDQDNKWLGAGDWVGQWICRGFEADSSLGTPGQRRQSWPQLLRARSAAVPAHLSRHSPGGMLSGMAAILTAFGFSTSRLTDHNHDVFHVSLVASPFAQDGFQIPLDNEFHDVTTLLPVEWAVLLSAGRAPKRAYCRARTLLLESDDEQIEVEVFVVESDADLPRAWRCVLRFELVYAGTLSALLIGPQGSSRRRLVVHAQVDEAKKHGLSASATATAQDTPIAQGQQLYSSIKVWSPCAAFKGIYSAVE